MPQNLPQGPVLERARLNQLGVTCCDSVEEGSLVDVAAPTLPPLASIAAVVCTPAPMKAFLNTVVPSECAALENELIFSTPSAVVVQRGGREIIRSSSKTLKLLDTTDQDGEHQIFPDLMGFLMI